VPRLGRNFLDEIPEVSNGPPAFGSNVGRQRKVVNLPVPNVQITANSVGFQAFRHKFGVREQQFVELAWMVTGGNDDKSASTGETTHAEELSRPSGS
jgi:hypothetical protein